MTKQTFLVDCDICKAKVAALQMGMAERGLIVHDNEPYGGVRLYVGTCPRCKSPVATHSVQTSIGGYDSDEDEWSDPARVFPNPPRVLNHRIPEFVRDSMSQAETCLRAGVHDPACVMIGRALEALCRDQLADSNDKDATGKPQKFMLGHALPELRKREIIDDKLLAWSKQLQAYRNIAAHSDTETPVTRADVLDLRTFAYAIIEYVYDLSERYKEFEARVSARHYFFLACPKSPVFLAINSFSRAWTMRVSSRARLERSGNGAGSTIRPATT